MDRKTAAEARRQKVLARGGDRLAQITGQLQEPAPGAPQIASATERASSVSPAPLLQAGSCPPPVAASTAAATPSPALCCTAAAAELDAAVQSGSDSVAPLSQQPQPKGTATNSKWAQYSAPGSGGRPKRRPRRVSAGETLSAAVQGTSRLRLLLASLLAVLLAARWDATAAAKAAASDNCSLPEAQSPSAAAAPEPGSPWTELGPRWQGLLQQTRTAVSALSSLEGAAKGQQQEATPPLPSEHQPQLLEGLTVKLRRQLAAAAATPAGMKAAAAAQELQVQLAAMAVSPAGRKATAAVQALRAQAAATAKSPAGVQAAAALQAVRAKLAAIAVSSAWQRTKAALAQLPPLTSLPQWLRVQLSAAAAMPAVQQGLDVAERLQPLACLALLSLSLIGASAVALVAVPGLVHSMLELELQSPGLLARLASAVPGLQQQLSLLAAMQHVMMGLLDDASVFVVALVAYYQLPQLLAGA